MSLRSPSPQTNHWAQINEATTIAGIRILFWIFRIFGKWPFRFFLYPVVGWYVLTKPEARSASENYLRRVQEYSQSIGIKQKHYSVISHFTAFAESILDKLLLWSGLFQLDNVSFSGHQPLLKLIEEQRGCLLICSHFGNLDLCRVLSKQRPGLRLTVMVHTKHAQKFNRLIAQIDPNSHLNLIQVTEFSPATAMLLSEKINQGEFIVIAGDRIPVSHAPRVTMADFLGAKAPFPVGPYILGSVLQCPVYLMFSLQEKKKAEIHFELLSHSISLPRNSREKALAELAGSFAKRLEHYCLRTPTQWFNFYDFWKSTPLDTTDAPY